MAEISGGEVIARMLQKEGVDKVFGIIDGTYFGFYSALHRLGIKIVTPRHETSAAHMAGAYARLTGKLGVCMASNGPGRGQHPARPGGRAGRGQSRAGHHQRAPAEHHVSRSRWNLSMLRSGRRHRQDGQVERSGLVVRAHPGNDAQGAAQVFRGPAGGGACRRSRKHHERQVQGAGRDLGAAPVPPDRSVDADG